MVEIRDAADYFVSLVPEFWLAYLVELAVIALVVRRTWGGARRPGPLGRRLSAERADTSGLWCMPLLVWALQANLFLGEMLQNPELAAGWRLHQVTVLEIFVSLLVVLTLQTLGTLVTRDAPATLGMTGHARTAATAAMLTVFLDVALFFMLWGEFATPGGLPRHLP